MKTLQYFRKITYNKIDRREARVMPESKYPISGRGRRLTVPFGENIKIPYFREGTDMPACVFEITRVLCRFLGGS